MSFTATVTYQKKASDKVVQLCRDLQDEIEGKPWFWFSIWDVKEAVKELHDGVDAAISILDNQMKGWKPVADGKETHHGMHADINNLEYWYQRQYTK